MKKILLHSIFYSLLTVIVLLSTFYFLPTDVRAAVFYFSPESQEVDEGATIVVELWVDAEGENINAVDVGVSFPVNVLQIIEINTGGSAFPLYPQEPVYSNERGSITLQAGVPNGLEGRGLIAKLFVRAIQKGEATLRFSEHVVFLNDGFGTSAAVDKKQAEYMVKEREGDALRINSAEYPSEDFWYTDSEVRFIWETKEGAAYSYELSRDPVDSPDEILEGMLGSMSYTLEEDGIFYFHIRECIDGACGTVVTRRIMKDSTAPDPFEVQLGQEKDAFSGKRFLSFIAIDDTSGVDRYEILETRNGKENTWQIVISPYVLGDDYVIRMVQVKAIDKAGNERISSLIPENRQSVYKKYFIFAIIIGIGILFLYIFVWVRKKTILKK